MGPEARVQRAVAPEPTWSWPGFPKKANRILSGFLEDLETPDPETDPELCLKRASTLRRQISTIALELNVEYKGGRPQIPYNPLADAFLARAVFLTRGQDVELISHLVELSDDIRFLAKIQKSPETSLIHPKVSTDQMNALLSMAPYLKQLLG